VKALKTTRRSLPIYQELRGRASVKDYAERVRRPDSVGRIADGMGVYRVRIISLVRALNAGDGRQRIVAF
jgi:hypothetical protein